jgi:hypothetical protein
MKSKVQTPVSPRKKKEIKIQKTAQTSEHELQLGLGYSSVVDALPSVCKVLS